MKTKYILLFLGSFLVLTSYGQQKWNMKSNVGIASGSSLVDGYYFSFDIGIPLGKALQLTPTFTYADMLPYTYFSNSWNNTYPLYPNVSYRTGGPRKEVEYGDNFGSISILLMFMPFELFKSDRLKKHELMVGAGYSLNSYTNVSAQYEINGDNVDLIAFSSTLGKSLEPYYCKIGYNYLFKENLLIGFVAGINGFDGEAELLTGFQFGVKF